MHSTPRAIATLLFLVLGLQLGAEAARCFEGGGATAMQPSVLAGAHEHHHCTTPESPADPGCPPQQNDCTMMSHCAVVMILPAAVQQVVSVATPTTPTSHLAAEPDSFRGAPTPPPPRA